MLKLTRRIFIKRFFFTLSAMAGLTYLLELFKDRRVKITSFDTKKTAAQAPEPEAKPGFANVYESKNGTPEQNMAKVIEMMGGIKRFVSKDDIVILKPNAQWWNQGMTNTNAMKAFIELVLGIPGFKGEVIIAENHHCYGPRGTPDIRGWTTRERNGDFNYNELIAFFRTFGYRNVTKYHWIDGGPFSRDETLKDKLIRPIKEITKAFTSVKRGRIVNGPEQGDGYVWTDIEYFCDEKKVKMSYPVFTSEFSKTVIDFKGGAWKNGKYTRQPAKFINFAGLNHHSDFAGATSSVKNYLGVVDMTCGYAGAEPQGYHSFHYIGIPGMGGAVAAFMKYVRKADLNIVTAEWVGFASRKDPKLAVKTKTIIAGVDPVALDYYGTKHILYPLGGPAAHLNNPDDAQGPLRKYLEKCSLEGGGILDEERINVHGFDFKI